MPVQQLDDISILDEMVRHVDAQAPIYRSSKFWERLVRKNREQISLYGLGNFKRTINQNYYNWMVCDVEDNQFKAAAHFWAQRPSLEAFKVDLSDYQQLEGFFEKNPLLDTAKRDTYRIFLGMLWHYTGTSVPNGLTESLVEPPLGNPLRSTLNGRLISQALANSIRERNALLTPFESELIAGRSLSIVELGAGYGRLGYVLLSSAPCRYTVVDIPPALFVSQWYLSSLFRAKAVFAFSPWTRFSDVAAELGRADVAFITPDQFALLPDDYFEVGVAISNLGELTKEQCGMYIDQLGRTVSRALYIKQWNETVNGIDDVNFTREDFALPAPWRPLFIRNDAIQDLFFEALWTRG